MASLRIEEASIPALDGKVALVTGGASGLGLAAVKILAERGAKVIVLDLQSLSEEDCKNRFSDLVKFVSCDVTDWSQLRNCFLDIGHVDMVFANAGIGEAKPFLHEEFDLGDDGLPLEPSHSVLDVNFRAVLNIIKLSWSVMRRQESGGSIVLTSSVAAYSPECSLPIYGSLKLALVGMVRSLRCALPQYNITINAVAPSAMDTPMVPQPLKDRVEGGGHPICSPHFVALALVYSAVAEESRRVEAYGKDNDADNIRKARWNGRVIMALGDQYTELEEPFSESRVTWIGQENLTSLRTLQAAMDIRQQQDLYTLFKDPSPH
ncbi:hypothetical protein MMC07_000733 [Pseudocyphellaria aurata]|nr:hypothetical protein [Pseudocyphellaria aurata]